MIRKFVAAMAVAGMVAVSSQFCGAEEGTPVKVTTENRGLIQIEGITKGNSEGGWGASNLILKPFGGWAAQDYCLKNIKKDGGTITADFSTKPAMKMVEELKEVKDADGKAVTQVTYTLTPADGKPASFEQAYAYISLASKDFAGGKVVLDDGTEVDIPAEPDSDMIDLTKETKSVKLVNGTRSIKVKSENLQIAIKDLRPKTTGLQIVLEHPDPTKQTELKISFEVSATK